MDPMDPLKPVKPPGASGPQPVTEEWFIQQKKLLKAAKMEQPTGIEAHDIFTPSPEMEALIGKDKYESFFEMAKTHILKMDRNSESFLPQATQKIVSTALEQEYGEKVTKDPGYPQMEKTLTKKILDDPRYREMVEEFLKTLSL